MNNKEIYPEIKISELYELFLSHDNAINHLYNGMETLYSQFQELEKIVNNLKGVK
jgi:hypothetical protein